MLVVINIVAMIGDKQPTGRDQICGGERLSLISSEHNAMLKQAFNKFICFLHINNHLIKRSILSYCQQKDVTD